MKSTDFYSGYGNAVLYRMCADQPQHIDDDVIAGKIWLIGRSYSVALERKAKKTILEGQDFYKDQIAPFFRTSEIDTWIDSVQQITRLDNNNLAASLKCHKDVMDMLNRAAGLDRRSFASKYLHFHAPFAFFIYDSIANTNVRKKLGRSRVPMLKGFDDSYSSFCARCLVYRTELEQTLGMQVTPRRLDMELLGYGLQPGSREGRFAA